MKTLEQHKAAYRELMANNPHPKIATKELWIAGLSQSPVDSLKWDFLIGNWT